MARQKKEEISDQQRLRNYWHKNQFPTLEEAIVLEFGALPPRDPDERPSARYQLIRSYAVDVEDYFDLMHRSLCADKKVGKEWEALSREEALAKGITRELFSAHWQKCGFSKSHMKKTIEEINPREKESLLKIVIAMAMKKFGYKPGGRTSAVPTIKNAIEEYGMKMDDETILKFLRGGTGAITRRNAEGYAGTLTGFGKIFPNSANLEFGCDKIASNAIKRGNQLCTPYKISQREIAFCDSPKFLS